MAGCSITINDTNEQIDNVSRIITYPQEKRIEECARRRKLYKKIDSHCGKFFFYRYDRLLDAINDDTATAFRFLYLCACADKEGTIMAFEKKPCTTIKDFTYVFDRQRGTVQKYVSDLQSYDLLQKIDGVYRVNLEYYAVNLKDATFKQRSVRAFNKAIRELYYNSDPNEHSMMGRFVKLTPYINVNNNIICWNIDKTSIEEIQPFTRQEIQFVLKSNSNYSYEILNRLENVTLKGEFVIGRFETGGVEHYKINPRLFYCGNNLDELKSLIYSFDLANYQYVEKTKRKKMRRLDYATN